MNRWSTMLFKVHYICIVYIVQYTTLDNIGHDNIVNDSIVDDMDEPTNKLIGRHNYCTQVSIACQDPTITYTYMLCVCLYT